MQGMLVARRATRLTPMCKQGRRRRGQTICTMMETHHPILHLSRPDNSFDIRARVTSQKVY